MDFSYCSLAAISFSTLCIWILAGVGVFVLFSLTVLIHEGGHFLAARLLGLEATTFSIGFGPALWKKQWKGTEFRLSAIPFGGYVSLPQLDPEGMQTIQGEHGSNDAADTPKVIPPAAWWKRIFVAFAGPFGNILFAVLLALLISALPPVVPDAVNFHGAVIGSVEPDSAAGKAGLRSGDRILFVENHPTPTWSDFAVETHLCATTGGVQIAVKNIFDQRENTFYVPVEKNQNGYYAVPGLNAALACAVQEVLPETPAAAAGIQAGDILFALNETRIVSAEQFVSLVAQSKGAPLTISFLRGKEQKEMSLSAQPDPDGSYKLGIRIIPYSAMVPQWAQHRNPCDQIKTDCSSIVRILKPLFVSERKGERSRIGSALGGPVMILSSLWMTILSGLTGALAFVRYININLAILNLLPFPVLDGGHICFALWRGIFRREFPPKLMNALVNFFAILVLLLFVVLSCKDILSLTKIFSR